MERKFQVTAEKALQLRAYIAVDGLLELGRASPRDATLGLDSRGAPLLD